jgi:GTPase SAR1 family protein
LYYKDAAVAVICYDITNKDTFAVMKYWYNEVKQHGKSDVSNNDVNNAIEKLIF